MQLYVNLHVLTGYRKLNGTFSSVSFYFNFISFKNALLLCLQLNHKAYSICLTHACVCVKAWHVAQFMF